MSTSKIKLQDEEVYELLDKVIYGSSTIYKYLSDPQLDISISINRCTAATKAIGATLRMSSKDDVCDECEREHELLISDVEDQHDDLDVHLDGIIDAYEGLQNENEALKRIIADLCSYAVETLSQEEIQEFEEHLIVGKLDGTR